MNGQQGQYPAQRQQQYKTLKAILHKGIEQLTPSSTEGIKQLNPTKMNGPIRFTQKTNVQCRLKQTHKKVEGK